MKRAFFASSDPGGANVIAAIARRMPDPSGYRVFTDPGGFRNADLEDRYEVVAGEADVAEIFVADQPDVVFTASSLVSDIELKMLREARRLGIPSAAVVDHWNDFANRFARGGDAEFPDRVFVIDETAVEMAVEQGVPRDRVEEFGHPHFYDAQFYVPVKSRAVFWRELGVDPERQILLFVSDALTETAGGREGARQRFGYVETDILELLLAALEPDSSVSVVVRPHPKENRDKLERILGGSDVVVVRGAPLWELLAHSDFVTGMFSSALLEAVAMGKRPLRIEVGAGDRNFLPVPDRLFSGRVLEEAELSPGIRGYLSGAAHPGTAPFTADKFSRVIDEWLL